MVKIFITGGTGFIGTEFTRIWLERGYDVFALVRDAKKDEAQSIQAMGA